MELTTIIDEAVAKAMGAREDGIRMRLGRFAKRLADLEGCDGPKLDRRLAALESLNVDRRLDILDARLSAIEKRLGTDRLTTRQVGEIYGLDRTLLARLRARGEGPEYHRFKRRVYYDRKAVEKFLRNARIRTGPRRRGNPGADEGGG